MAGTYIDAEDEIYTVFKAAWDTTGYANNVAYPNRAFKQRKGTKQPWVQVAATFVTGGQASFETGGVKLFDRSGLFTARVHAPANKDGSTVALQLATIISDAFEAVSANNVVWYSNVRVNNIGIDGSYYVVNVIADFFYQQVK